VIQGCGEIADGTRRAARIGGDRSAEHRDGFGDAMLPQ
jgi:hypothetical protein